MHRILLIAIVVRSLVGLAAGSFVAEVRGALGLSGSAGSTDCVTNQRVQERAAGRLQPSGFRFIALHIGDHHVSVGLELGLGHAVKLAGRPLDVPRAARG